MHMAIVCNRIEVIEILHQHGASVTDVPLYGQVPHSTDCQVRNRDLLGVLYKYGVRAVDDFVPYSEMSSLAEKAAHALFKHMILCTCGNSVMSPLACAVHYRNRAAARKLIELGANVNAFSKVPEINPLVLACILGFSDMVEDLIDFGADYSEVDALNFLPIHTAIKYNHPSVVQTLINKGCDPNVPTIVRGKPDLTPFQLACIMRCPEIVQILHKLVPDIHQLTPDHLSPLHLASVVPGVGYPAPDGSVTIHPLKIKAARQEETVKLLLKYGCDVNATTLDLTPLDFAIHFKLEKVVYLLTQARGERGDKIRDREEMKRRFEYIEGRLGSLSQKFDQMEARIQTLEEKQLQFKSVQNPPHEVCQPTLHAHLSECVCCMSYL